MEVKFLNDGRYELKMTEQEFDRVKRLTIVFGMTINEVISYMFGFADHMATTRILNKIEK